MPARPVPALRRAAIRLGAAVAVGALTAACAADGSRPVVTPTVRSAVPNAAGSSTVPAAGAASSTVPSAAAASAPACAANRHAQLVRVSLSAQHLWMCAGHRLVRDTAITSGMTGQYTETPTGTFTVQGRTRHTTLTLADGQTYRVRYWIPFDAPLYGFHDASWQTFPYGSATYRTRGSHGCVHVPVAALGFLYRWAQVGATVRITA